MNKEGIIFRKIKRKDYKYIKKMANTNFKLYKYIEDERVLKSFLDMYLYSCILEKKFSLIAENKGEAIGVILGTSKYDKKNNIFEKFFNLIMYSYYFILTFLKSKIYKCDIKKYKGITNIYKSLMKNANKTFDGILTLFIVSEKFQKRGIGKKLLQSFFEYEKNKNCNNLYVYTDSNCNYKFYEKNLFKKIGEDIFEVKNQTEEFDLHIYLYEYEFK